MKLMQDYQWLKGVNYTPSTACNDIEFWRDYDHDTVERELGYAKQMGLNSVRVWLAYVVYRHNREAFLQNVLDFVRTADSLGLKTIPVVWDSCFSEKEPRIDVDVNDWYPNPGVMYLDEKYWPGQEQYCADLIALLKDEPGLLLWDVHNEPLCTSYYFNYEGEEREAHVQLIWKFVKHYCDFFHAHDSLNPITVGVSLVKWLPDIMDWCDILSFHDYSESWEGVRSTYAQAIQLAKAQNKPVFCSEMGCTARANPYAAVIQIANEMKMGYLMFDLIIGKSIWNDRHGLVYPDGAIRDATIIAALQGFFLRREDMVDVNVNTELYAEKAVRSAEEWMAGAEKDYDEGLELLCRIANFVEGGQLAPPRDLPSMQYAALKKAEARDALRIAEALNRWLPVLKADFEAKRGVNYDPLIDPC